MHLRLKRNDIFKWPCNSVKLGGFPVCKEICDLDISHSSSFIRIKLIWGPKVLFRRPRCQDCRDRKRVYRSLDLSDIIQATFLIMWRLVKKHPNFPEPGTRQYYQPFQHHSKFMSNVIHGIVQCSRIITSVYLRTPDNSTSGTT